MKLPLIFGTLLAMGMASCLDNIDQRPQLKEEPVVSERPFKYWTWITADPKRDETSYIAEFKKYKENGLDAILINTNTDPVLLGRLAPLAKTVFYF